MRLQYGSLSSYFLIDSKHLFLNGVQTEWGLPLWVHNEQRPCGKKVSLAGNVPRLKYCTSQELLNLV